MPAASGPTPAAARWAEAWAQTALPLAAAHAELQRSLPGCGLPTVAPPAAALPADEPRRFHCSGCACQHDFSEHRNNRAGADFCRPCYSQRYMTCAACSGEVEQGYDYYSNESDGPFCERCYMTVYAHCNGCSAEAVASELRESPITGDRARYCGSCYNSRFTACAGCSRAMFYDDVAYTDEYDGDNYCPTCAP